MINISIFDMSIATFDSKIRDYFYVIVNGLHDRLDDTIYLSGSKTSSDDVYPPTDHRIHAKLGKEIYPYFNPATALDKVLQDFYFEKPASQKEYPGVVDIYFSSIFYNNIEALEAIKRFIHFLPHTRIKLYFMRNHLTEAKTIKFFGSFIQEFRDNLEFVILDI
jgi:hypothetical protein